MVKGVVESLKIVTRQVSLRVAEYAFLYAKNHGRQRVSAIHKANIMQKTDGLFLKVLKQVLCSILVTVHVHLLMHPFADVFSLPSSVVVRLQRSTPRLHMRKLSLTIAV